MVQRRKPKDTADVSPASTYSDLLKPFKKVDVSTGIQRGGATGTAVSTAEGIALDATARGEPFFMNAGASNGPVGLYSTYQTDGGAQRYPTRYRVSEDAFSSGSGNLYYGNSSMSAGLSGMPATGYMQVFAMSPTDTATIQGSLGVFPGRRLEANPFISPFTVEFSLEVTQSGSDSIRESFSPTSPRMLKSDNLLLEGIDAVDGATIQDESAFPAYITSEDFIGIKSLTAHNNDGEPVDFDFWSVHVKQWAMQPGYRPSF
jgi:hypothetical protein